MLRAGTNRARTLAIGVALGALSLHPVPARALTPPVYSMAWGGYGPDPGQFFRPFGVAYANGTVYVSDPGGNLGVQHFDAFGHFLDNNGYRAYGIASPVGSCQQLTGEIAMALSDAGQIRWAVPFGTIGSGDGQMFQPQGVTVDDQQSVWVADTGNNRIQKFTKSGTFILKAGSSGSGPGQFNTPYAIANFSLNIYVVDRGNNRIEVFREDNGQYLFTIGSAGAGPGQFDHPAGISIDCSGRILVADQDNNRVQSFASDGTFQMMWGALGSGPGQFDHPVSVDSGPDGSVFVVDAGNYRIEKFVNGVTKAPGQTWGRLKILWR